MATRLAGVGNVLGLEPIVGAHAEVRRLAEPVSRSSPLPAYEASLVRLPKLFCFLQLFFCDLNHEFLDWERQR